MHDDFYKKLGKNIKKYREEANLTQDALALKIDKSLNFVGKIEVAFSRPALNTVIDIANALNVSVSKLTDFDDL